MELSRLKNNRTAEISALFTGTFTDSEGKEEGALIGTLAEDFLTKTPENDLYAFIATDGGKVVGCIFFSRLSFEKSSIPAFLMAPVAISTAYQGKGLGQRLINFAHAELQKEGVQLVVTYGDIQFYGKVGYQCIRETVVPAPLPLSYPEGWLAQSLTGGTITPIEGRSFAVEAISKPVYW